MPYLAKHKTEKFLWAVSDVNNGSESSLLESAKINFTRAALYRTVSNDFAPDEASITTCLCSSARRESTAC